MFREPLEAVSVSRDVPHEFDPVSRSEAPHWRRADLCGQLAADPFRSYPQPLNRQNQGYPQEASFPLGQPSSPRRGRVRDDHPDGLLDLRSRPRVGVGRDFQTVRHRFSNAGAGRSPISQIADQKSFRPCGQRDSAAGCPVGNVRDCRLVHAVVPSCPGPATCVRAVGPDYSRTD